MTKTLDLVEGWTSAIDFTLESNGAAANLTGAAVEMEFDGTAASGTVDIVSPLTGRVRYSPADGDLSEQREPYDVRFKVTDGDGKVTYFPNGEPLKVRVRR